MTFSQDTETILQYLENYAPHGLRKRLDIGVVLEVGAHIGAAQELNDLVFTGKVVWNLYVTLRKAGSNQDAEAVQREFTTHIQTLRENLLPFVANAPEDVQGRFEAVYLGVNDGTLRNLVDLACDLAQLKDVQSDQRRSRGIGDE